MISSVLNILRPGWPDEIRRIPQESTFRNLVKGISVSGPRVLNAGCGEGLYNAFLKSLPGTGTLVNMDLDQTKNYLPHPVRGSLTGLPFKNTSFDFCLASEVLEHIENDSAAVSEIERVLRPDAYLLISVPHPPAPHDPSHVREGYTLQELTALLARHGLAVRRHAFCLHFFMRFFYILWEWQFEILGRKKRTWMPRIAGLAAGHLDRLLKIGKPWDLVVLAQKNGRPEQVL